MYDLEESDFFHHLKSDSSNIDHSKLDKSNGRMVGFKFHNADFITDNFINKSIEDFIKDGEIKTQFGEVKWSIEND